MISALFLVALVGFGPGAIVNVPCCTDTVPTITCDQAQWCDLQMPPGDAPLKDAPPVTDETTWELDPVASSPAHVFFRPRSASAPKTLLTVTMRDRTYHLFLVAVAHTASVVYRLQPPPPPTPDPVTASATPTPPPALHLTGTYRVTGRAPFTVTRVGTDGIRTFIFLPLLQSYPDAKTFDDFGREQIRTYAVHVLSDGSREYIIPGVWNHIELSLGGGKHTVFLRLDRVH